MVSPHLSGVEGLCPHGGGHEVNDLVVSSVTELDGVELVPSHDLVPCLEDDKHSRIALTLFRKSISNYILWKF